MRAVAEALAALMDRRCRPLPGPVPGAFMAGLGDAPLFEVIELLVENRLLIEVATPEMLRPYTDLFRFPVLDAFFASTEAVAA